jgi:hypothetical protein
MTMLTAIMIRSKLPDHENKEKKEKKENPGQPRTFCGCYNEHSTDARCCGLCYCCCPAKHIDKAIDHQRCDCCPNDFCEYWYSGYVQTTAGYGNQEEDLNGVCCWLCFPVKISMFFPCLLGSLCNQVINACCAATTSPTLVGICSAPNKRNYLF